MTHKLASSTDTIPGEFLRLIEIMRTLRSPEGCPWDREQTHESLRPYLVEETYEVLDSIDRGAYPELKKELGDLLLHIVFHAQLMRFIQRVVFQVAKLQGMAYARPVPVSLYAGQLYPPAVGTFVIVEDGIALGLPR